MVSFTTFAFSLPLRSTIPNTGVLSFVLRPCENSTFLSACRFLFLPPTYVSSSSTVLVRSLLFSIPKQLRMRCSINHAVFCVTSISRLNCSEEIPFLWQVTSHIAANHFLNGTFELSKSVFVLILKYFPVFLQRYLLPLHL